MALGLCAERTAVSLLAVSPNASWTHCGIHREALASKHMAEAFQSILNTAVKIVKFIKLRPLQSRIFEKLFFYTLNKIRGFMSRLRLWKNNIDEGKFDCSETFETFIFENALKVPQDISSDISEHLSSLRTSFNRYFGDQMENYESNSSWSYRSTEPARTRMRREKRI